MRGQIRSVQRRDNGGAEDGGSVTRSTRSTGSFGKNAFKDAAGINPICTGATIRAEDSLNAGMGALRWQHGGTGAEAGDDPRGKAAAWPSRWVRLGVIWLGVIWFFMAQWAAQQVLAVEAGEMQSASPNAGAKSTARSKPEAMSLRNCIACLYTNCRVSRESRKKEAATAPGEAAERAAAQGRREQGIAR
ncbi:MAG: hypothetical protein ABSD13_04045 [Candidatus Korobacteraceae bacterium]|jgi:hypothetical protein